jgi:hypothetical protein
VNLEIFHWVNYSEVNSMKKPNSSYILYKGGDIVREIEVFIDTEEIAEFFFHQLVKRGYVPTEEELEEIADITFEYLIDKSIIDEEVEDE